MNEVKKITNLVIDKQPNLDINQLINCLNDCQERINKAIEYYETYKQECVIGRNKDEKLIKDYYLPAQCSKKLIEILKGE